MFINLQPLISTGAKKNIDSLLQILPVQPDGRDRLNTLISIGKYYRESEYLRAIPYIEQALAIARETNDLPNIGVTCDILGFIYDRESMYDSSLKYYSLELQAVLQLTDSTKIAIAYKNVGDIYLWTSDFAKCMDCYYTSIGILERHNTIEQCRGLYNNVAIVLEVQKDYMGALKYYKQSLELDLKIKTAIDVSLSYRNIGMVYISLKNFDEALSYCYKALEIDQKNHDARGVSISHLSLGEAYNKLNVLDTAEYHLRKSVFIMDSLGLKDELASVYNILASVLIDQGRYEEAIANIEKGREIAETIGEKVNLFTSYEGLASAYSKLGNYKLAYHYHSKYTALKDSIFNKDRTRLISEMEVKYATEQKRKELVIKDLKLDQQHLALQTSNQLFIASLTGVGLLLVLAIVIFRSLKQKQKSNQVLSLQKDKIEEHQLNMTDSIDCAKQLQSAMLPDTTVLNNQLKGHFILYLPKDIVSGDFYWALQQNNNIFIAACDCTGHGVPGAFVSILGYNLLSQIVKEQKVNDPGMILTKLNQGVQEVFRNKNEAYDAMEGMDISFVKLSYSGSDCRVQYCGANIPIYLIKEDGFEIVKGERTVIGGKTPLDHQFKTVDIDTHNLKSFYMCSDGYQAQFGGENGKKFMVTKFRKLIQEISTQSCDEQKNILEQTLKSWRGDIDQVDDVLIIGVQL